MYIPPLSHEVLALYNVYWIVASEELLAAAHLQLLGEPGKHMVPESMKATA